MRIANVFRFVTAILISITFVHVSASVASNDQNDCEPATLAAYEKQYLENKDEHGFLPTDKLEYTPSGDQFVTQAEAIAFAYYTKTYKMEKRIMYCGALKLPAKVVTVYRGQSTKKLGELRQGQIITLNRIISTSTNKIVAGGFTEANTATGELLVIHAKTARDISRYSQCYADGVDEKEHFLLPGTQLKVESIYADKIPFWNEVKGEEELHPFRHVEMVEL